MFKIYLAVCAISVIAKAEPQQATIPKFLTQYCNNKGNCKVDSTRIKICTSINNGIILSREIFQLGNGTVNMIRGSRKYSIKDGKFLGFYEKYSVSCTTYDVK
jgi:hypothetical protein